MSYQAYCWILIVLLSVTLQIYRNKAVGEV
nr:MAG TPA: hypothetical protein [Caudoviricetes sp.]